MKIIIDISAEDFENVKCGRGAVSMMRKAIIHGTPLTPEQYKIMRPIESYHAKAMALGYIEKPLAWALHQVWKEVDKAESEVEK